MHLNAHDEENDGRAPDARLTAVRDAEIRAAVEQVLSTHGARAIRSFERRFSAYSTSFTIDEIDVQLDGEDWPRRLVLKDLGWDSLLAGARDVRPRFLYDPLREIRVYERLLTGRRLGTAHCWGAVVDPPRDRCWLFLERVQAEKLAHVGEFAIWTRVAGWLAEAQAQLSAPATSDDALPLLRHDRAYYEGWLARATEFVRARPHMDAATLRDFARLAERYDRVTARLAAMPVGFLHGEFYASNILVGREGNVALRVCPVDWETAAIGPAAMDLAALTSGQWDADQRTTLIAAYRDVAAGLGPVPSIAEFLECVDCCLLQLAVQWTGWAQGWDAPADQAQDWAREAVRIARRLGIL